MQKIFSKQISGAIKRFIAGTAGVASCAALLAAPPPPPVYVPDILVTGLNMPVEDGSMSPLHFEGTYFNQVQLGKTSWDHYFEIRNFGNADLLLSGPVTVANWNAADFHVTQQPLGVIAPGQSATFSLRFVPSFVGEAYGEVHIGSNDPDEGDYTFIVRGDGIEPATVGPDLDNTNFHYKKYKCKGVPRYCKINGSLEVHNLSTDTDVDRALVNVYALNGNVVNSEAILVDQRVVKKLKAYRPGKKLKTKRVKFKGYFPETYTHLFSEVIPIDGTWDINYSNNTSSFGI